MSFRKILMVGMMGGLMGVSVSGHATGPCDFALKLGGICFFQDVVTALANHILNKTEKKLINPTFDVKEGLERIKENIGMYQDQGKCGISETGASGCTDEKNAAAAAGQPVEDPQQMVEALMGGTGLIVELAESKEASGDIKATLDGIEGLSQAEKDYFAKILGNQAQTFAAVRENVTNHVFQSDDEAVNEGCSATDYDPSECAEQRQGDFLMRSSTLSSAIADIWLRELSGGDGKKTLYDSLEGHASKVRGAETPAQFVGALGNLSYFASSVAVEQIALMTYDLRAQSYRNLMYSGTEKKDLADLNKEACSAENLGGCKDKDSCEHLTSGAKKYKWVDGTKKCEEDK